MGVGSTVTPEDVTAELEAAARLEQRRQQVLERYGGEQSLAELGGPARGPTRSGADAGWTLCEQLPGALRRRVWTLIGLEGPMLNSLDGQVDFWGAVWMGCQVAEGVLGELLSAPAREVSDALLDATAGSGPPRQVLEDWLAGQPPTLAALQVVQRAFREAHANRRAEIEAVMGPEGAAFLAGGGPEASLEQIRGLRTRAESPSREMSRVEYVDLLKWMVGARTLELWDRQGPRPNPPRADVALMHHHLRLRRLRAPGAA